MPITFLDEEEEIVPVAPKKTGKRRINPLDEEEPPEEEGVKPESEVITTTSGRKITFLDEEEEPIAPVVEPETPSASEPPTRITFLDEEPEPPTIGGLSIPPAPEVTKFEATKPKESFLRPVADPFLNIGAGINDVLKGFTDAFGADNAVSQNLAKNSEWYRGLLSAGAKQDQEEIGRIMQEAEGQGVLSEIGAGLKALSVAPVDLVSQGIGSLIPFIATAGVGKAVGLSKAGIAVLQGVQGGAVGGGIVKGEIYDAVKDQLVNSGVDEDKAEKAAQEAQAYNGKNLDQIMLGVGLGVATSTTGADSAIRSLISRKVGKETAEQVSEQAVQEVLRTGFVRGAVKDGAVEFATEALQGGQERLAANVAVGREGFDVEPMRGVVGQATLEGALGGILGGGAGGISARVAQRDAREAVALRDAQKAAEEAKQNNSPASAAAVEEQIEQVGETLNIPATVTPRREGETDQQWRARIEQERAETPDQRVARLQREAQEGAGEIELEEEPPVSGLPPQPVTPTPEAPPVAPVAPVEPVVPEGAPAQPAAVDAPTEPVAPTEPAAEPAPVVTPRPAVDVEALSPNAKRANRILTNAGVDPETAAFVSQQYQDEIVDLGGEELRAFVLDKFEENGGVIPAQMRYSEDQEYYELAFGIGPEEAATLVENAKAQNAQMAQNELEQNKQWRRKDGQQITETQQGVAVAQPEAQAVPVPAGEVPPSPAIEGRRIPLAAPEAAPVTPTPTEVAPTAEPPALAPLRRVAKAEQTEDDVSGLVGQGLVELYNGQPVITQAGLETLPEAERPRLTPEARKIQIDTRTSEAAAEAISKNLRIGVDQVPFDVRMPAGWTLVGDIYIPPVVEAAPSPQPEARESRVARDPEVQKAAQDLKDGTIDRDEYQRIVDMRMPLRKFEAVPIPANNEDMLRGLGERKAGDRLKKDLIKDPESIAEGTVLEARLDIPAYESEDVWVVSLHKQRTDLQKGTAAEVVAYTPTSVLRNVTFGVTEKAAAGIAAGKPKSTIATMRGEYVPMTAEQAYELATTNKDKWVEIGMNPVRHSYFYDKDTQTPVESAEEVVQVGGMVLAKNPVFGKREDYLYSLAGAAPTVGMTTDAVRARLEDLGFGVEGMIRIVEDPQAAFEGRTIIQDGKAVRIELNASALRDNAAIDRVLNHEFAESANADGALNKLVERLTPKEKKEINDAITRLGYEERVRTTEEAARAIEALAAGWKGRGFFERAVARVEAWGSKLGLKLTRRAAEYIAARNLSDINAGFKAAYNRFINVRGEAREGRAFVTPEENARFMDLAKDPETNREELQRMVDSVSRKAGYTSPILFHGSIAKGVKRFDVGQAVEVEGGIFFTTNEDVAAQYTFERAYGDIISDEPLGDVTAAKLRMDNPLEYQAKGKIVDAVEMQRVINQAKADGFDGVIIRNIDDSIGMTGDMGDVYIVFNGNQIKSADPVTYDDQGNVIPLDQRFQPTSEDIRYSRTKIRESRREPAPTFTEESPEAKTLSNLKASMEKVDAASEAKGGKPETQKVSEIAANWMEQGGDERALQDAITENTNLSPVNASKVAKVIAKQYGLQQQIAETGAVIAEIAPEAEGAPRKSSVTKLIEQTTGVRKPVVKFQVSESAALKKQIQLKAREARETRKARKEAAEDLAKSITDYVKANPIRGPINSRQAMSITKRALKLDVNNEAAVDRFEMYVERVIENANYDRDLADARSLIKRAKTFAKAKDTQGNVKTTLDAIANISPTLLDNPFEFNLVVQRYLLGLAPVTAKQYAVMPDADVRRYLESLETQISANQDVLDRSKAQRILDKQAAYAEEKGIPLDEAISILNSEEFLNEKTIEKLEDLTKLLTSMAQESQKDVRAYDETGATPKQKELISFMGKVNLDSLTNEEKKRYIRFSNNLLANGATFGMEQFQSIALGQESAIKALKDKRLSNKLAAWISPIGGDKAIDTARRIALKTQSEADTFKNIFGREAVGAFRKILGLNRLDVAQTDSNKAKEQIANEFGEYFKGLRKKYGNDATGFDAKGYAGIAGYLIQTDGIKTEAESIPYRRRLMEQNIVELRKSDKQSDIAEADLKERALAQLTGTTNAEILSQLKALNPASYEQLMWVKDVMLPKWRDFLKEHDENFRNQANNYNNPDHLTITYKFPEGQLLPNEIEDVYQQDAIGMRIKQAANSIKRKEHSNLPVSPRTGTVANIDINFGYNQYNALVDQVDKAFVAPAWEQVVAFTKAPEFEQVMGGRANSLFVKKLLTDIQTSRTRQSMTDDEAQMVAGGVRLARKISTQAVLGGFTQPLRQIPDQLSKLFFTTGRVDLIKKNLLKTAEAAPLLNKFPISRRGDAQAGTQYASQFSELARKVEASVTDRKWAQYRELMNRVGEFWMAPLRGSDVWAAKVSWMSYYEAELNKNGIKMESWEREAELVETDDARKEAASYAEFAVDFYGGASDPTKMASLSKQTNNGWKEFAKLLFLPLNSFALQQKNSLISDLRDAYLRTGDRKASIAAISGTLAGMAAFHGMRIYIIGGLLYPAGKALLMGIFGIDMDEPDEEEKQKQLEDNWRKFKASMYGNIVAGGAGEFAEKAAIDAVNRTAYLWDANINPDSLLNDKGEIMSFRQYEKEVSPLYRFRSYGSSEYSFGLADVLTEQATHSLAETQQLLTPEEMERYTGNEQAYAAFATGVEWMYFFRLMDTDVKRIATDLKRQMDKGIEEREKDIKAIRGR